MKEFAADKINVEEILFLGLVEKFAVKGKKMLVKSHDCVVKSYFLHNVNYTMTASVPIHAFPEFP